MRKSDKYYEEFGGDRVVPETDLEIEILRNAILNDRWDFMPEHQTKDITQGAFLSRTGGQAIIHKTWIDSWIIHYAVEHHNDDGMFELILSFINERNPLQSLQIHMFAALRILRRPPFQCGWSGSERKNFVCPWWYFYCKSEIPRSLVLLPQDSEWRHGAFFVSTEIESKVEWRPPSPHVQLIDPQSLKDIS
jgi:hypothetical protein